MGEKIHHIVSSLAMTVMAKAMIGHALSGHIMSHWAILGLCNLVQRHCKRCWLMLGYVRGPCPEMSRHV